MGGQLSEAKRKLSVDFKNLARLAATFAARVPDQPKKDKTTQAKKKTK